MSTFATEFDRLFEAELDKLNLTDEEKAALKETMETKANNRGFGLNSLPAMGQFKMSEGSFSIDEQFGHYRATVANSGASMSTRSLLGQGAPIDQEAILKEGRRGFYLLSKTLNPDLSGMSPKELLGFLEGKFFTAEPVELQVLPFKEGDTGYETEDEAREALVVKTFYRITLYATAAEAKKALSK